MFDRWTYLDKVYFTIAREHYELQKQIIQNDDPILDEKGLAVARETLEILDKVQSYFIQLINKV